MSLPRACPHTLCALVFFHSQTANVDYETDRFIQQTLRTSPRLARRTLIVIAHRLDTVADADVILWLDGGRLKACGPAAEVLAQFQAEDTSSDDAVLEEGAAPDNGAAPAPASDDGAKKRAGVVDGGRRTSSASTVSFVV